MCVAETGLHCRVTISRAHCACDSLRGSESAGTSVAIYISNAVYIKISKAGACVRELAHACTRAHARLHAPRARGHTNTRSHACSHSLSLTHARTHAQPVPAVVERGVGRRRGLVQLFCRPGVIRERQRDRDRDRDREGKREGGRGRERARERERERIETDSLALATTFSP